ncbi:MAG: NFACT RNA binding domain-containing protein, partial [Bacilli bacterium]|nr:NFACT RNA binding domain-containing protein [Bacilli bacterium]
KSYVDNANILFKKYKKSKETIAKDKEQIEINNALIEKLNHDICSLNETDESIYLVLASEYLKTPISKQEVNKLSPFFVLVDNTKIAFGRNAIQNDMLTFKRASKENYFFHIKDYAGSHVVILKNNPNDKDKENAAMLALALSNKEAGEVQMAQIKNIKKGQFIGQVIFSSYSVVRINKVNTNIKVALNNVKRINL